MFTGIIQSVGRIAKKTAGQAAKPTGIELEIETGFKDLELGESVAINGVCLTVAELRDSSTIFFVSPETLARTGLGELGPQAQVNLERALLPHTRLSGHIVQGHVDGLARTLRIETVGSGETACYELELELPGSLCKYVVEKGSITLDGVSLTVNTTRENRIQIMLIPHTWTHTAFRALKTGAFVNVEVDVMAKYLEKLCQPYLKP
jgi:riboflavin synthase